MTIPVIPQMDPGQAGKEQLFNETTNALRPFFVLGYSATLSTGLTGVFLGGRFNGADLANQTITFPASATSYVEYVTTTGVISYNMTGYTGGAKSKLGVAVTSSTGVLSFVAEPLSALSSSTVGAMTYIGTWNASTNTPALASGVGTKGSVYKVSVAGTTTLDGISTWAVGDEAIFDGSTWDRLSGGSASPLTTKGDLFAFDTMSNRLPIGSNAQVLTADSTQPFGMKWATPAAATAAGIAINSQSAAYTTVLADANGAIYHPPADTTARTFTIAANASVPYPIGTAITFDNDFGAGVLTIAIASDTLVLVGTTGSTGSRTLAAGGQASALKVSATRWRINGNGLT